MGRQAGRVWNGQIERTPVTVITSHAQRGEVLVKIDDADGDLLRHQCDGDGYISSEANALSIPRDALHAETAEPMSTRLSKTDCRGFVTTGTQI